MSAGAWMMILVGVISVGSLTFILVSMVRSISEERDRRRGIMREFGLSIALMALFVITWFAQGVAGPVRAR